MWQTDEGAMMMVSELFIGGTDRRSKNGILFRLIEKCKSSKHWPKQNYLTSVIITVKFIVNRCTNYS